MRIHAQGRQRRFLAAASKVPCPLDRFEGERITLRLLEDGSSSISSDEIDRYVQETETWKGFTFLRLLGGAREAQPVLHPRGLREAVQAHER